MSGGREFETRVYDKHLNYLGEIRATLTEDYTVRHMGQTTGSMTVTDAAAYRAGLSREGARVVVRYRGEYLMGGPAKLVTLAGPDTSRSRTVEIAGDWHRLVGMYGFPVPGVNPRSGTPVPGGGWKIPGQSASEYDVRVGPAETVVKDLIRLNASRFADFPLTIPPSQGRGGVIEVQFRMHQLTDRLMPLADAAGIGVRIRQEGSGFLLETYVPALYPHELSEAGRTLLSSEVTLVPPVATAVIVSAKGEKTERDFFYFEDADAQERLGYSLETERDARDVWNEDMTNAQYLAAVAARGAEELADCAAQSGLELKLSETSTFRYGGEGGYREGDWVDAVVVPERVEDGEVIEKQVIRDRIRACTLTYTRDRGHDASPQMGTWPKDPIVQLVNAIRGIRRDARRRVD